MLVVCPHCLRINRLPGERAGEGPDCGHCHRSLLGREPVTLDDASFARVASKTELPLVVDFWAAWCGPCRQMAPQFAAAAAQLHGRAMFVKVDSEASPQTAGRFAIRSIPTLLLLRADREVQRHAGAVPAAQIVAWVQAAL